MTTPTATENLDALRAQLNSDLLRQEELRGELESVQTRIRATRNALEGARLGAAALGERLTAEAQKRAETPPESVP